MNAPTTTPVDLFADALHFAADGSLVAGPPRRADAGDEWQLFVAHCETEADVHGEYWEMHPEGDEAVCCLRGGIRVVLRATGADDRTVTLHSGEAVIVPRATWHRLELDEPSDISAVGMVRGTRLELRSPEEI